LALTKLDILDSFVEIKVAVGYSLRGEDLASPPALVEDWHAVTVHYESLPGWQCETAKMRDYDQLPHKCRDYIEFIEKFVGVPVRMIGVGADRGSLIVRDGGM